MYVCALKTEFEPIKNMFHMYTFYYNEKCESHFAMFLRREL